MEELQTALKTLLFLIVLLALFFSSIGFFFSNRISVFLFDSPNYTNSIRVCWIAVAVAAISKGLIAIVNGFQQIRKYVFIHVFGYLLSCALFVTSIIKFKSATFFPYLLLVNELCILTACLCFFPYRKIDLSIPLSFYDSKKFGKHIIKLTLGFFSAVILSSIMPLCTKSFLNHQYGLEIVGLYQAAWQVSGLYTGFIISSMGVDFIPRATKVIDSKTKLNDLVNDQIVFGLLLSGIAIVAVISFSDLFLTILYTSKFVKASYIIRWQILGVALRVISFPFTYSLIALGKSKVYLIIQTLFWIGEFLLLVFVSNIWGEKALGSNYFIGYSIYTISAICTGIYYFNYRPTKKLMKLAGINMISIVFSLVNVYCFSGLLRVLFSCVIITFLCTAIWKQSYSILNCSPLELIRLKTKQ